MVHDLFTDEDLKRIRDDGISKEDIMTQLKIFKRGFTPVKLKRPCTAGDGIVVIPDTDRTPLIKTHDAAARQGRMIKFVPASGAASRMFRDWFRYEAMEDFKTSQSGTDFVRDLPQFAFYNDLQKIISQNGRDINDLIKDGELNIILSYILTSKGLNYAHLPKALLKFHAYPEHNRTSLEEHLVEAALYVQNADHKCNVHFTVSDEHKLEVQDHITRVRKYYEDKYGVTYNVSVSIQLPSTNTIAVDMYNSPFRNDEGKLVFRPGGHGALLKNLNAIDGDIIFLKNIDNVTPDRLKPAMVLHKKILAGYLVQLQEEIFANLRLLTEEHVDDKILSGIARFCNEKLFIGLPVAFEDFSPSQKIDIMIDKLNRPLRVCGMVKNEGEPGGGPFWIGENGTQSLQIIEQAQIDFNSDEQKRIWNSSTHFNPVDLVCGVKDYRDHKFDLEKYVDKNAYLISDKSLEGRNLKALELPGLWNGAMARWNTVFVEVPIITFNPVKTINDLLRKEHLPD